MTIDLVILTLVLMCEMIASIGMGVSLMNKEVGSQSIHQMWELLSKLYMTRTNESII